MNNPHELVKPSTHRAGHLWPVVATLLAAFTLRIVLLGNQNIWWDEGLAIWAVRQGLTRMTLWTASDVHPPIYFWLLQFFVRLGGESEFSARFVSLVCGVLTVALLYALGKALLGHRIAVLGTLLLAFARFHVWWSQEMRMYIVATLWGVLSVYALVRWFRAEGWLLCAPLAASPREQHPTREAWGYVLATVAGLYTLYLFATVILIENVFFLVVWLVRGRGRRLRLSASDAQVRAFGRWVGAQLAVLTLFVPWLALALPRMHSWSVATDFDFAVFLRLYATLLTLGISTFIERYTWLVLPFAVLVGGALLSIWRGRTWSKTDTEQHGSNRLTALLFCLFLIVPPGVVYLLTRPRSLFYTPKVEARYLVLFAPVFYLLLAWSLVGVYRRSRRTGIVVAIFIAGTFLWTLPGHYVGRYLRDEHQTMVRIIAAYAEPGDAVLLVSGSRYPIFDYYYGRLPSGSLHPPVYNLPQHAPELTGDNVEAELAPLAVAHSRLWLAQVNAPMEDPQGIAAQWLDQHYAKIQSFGFAYNALTLYAPQDSVARVHLENLTPQHTLAQPLGPNMTLLGYDLPTDEFRPDDTIRLALYCAVQADTTLHLRLLDAQDRVLEQREINLSAKEPVVRQQVDWQVYANTPSGLYHFDVICPVNEQEYTVSLGALRIASTLARPVAGTPSVPMTATLEDGIEFLGYTLRNSAGQPVQSLRAGESVTVELYWRAQHKVSHNYTVFTHLVGQAYNPATAGPLWAGQDSQPLSGGYPTMQWFVGDKVVDRHVLQIDPNTPAGEYELEVGMYLWETMTRLSVMVEPAAQDQVKQERILLGRFPMSRP